MNNGFYGIISALLTSIIIMPVDIVKNKIQLRQYPDINIIDNLKTLYEEDKLFIGFEPEIYSNIIQGFIRYFLYGKYIFNNKNINYM